MKTIAFEKVLDFSDIAATSYVADVTADLGGNLAVLVWEGIPPAAGFKTEDWLTLARARPEEQTIITFSLGPTKVSIRQSGKFNFVRSLSGSRWLLAQARNEANESAVIIDAKGESANHFHPGDGIQDVQVDPAGKIWMSYFDEGVFGASIGTGGLLCFDEHGRTLLSYNHEVANSDAIPAIDDCYAMTVDADSRLWAYYYYDFPLVRIDNHRMGKIWRDVPLNGAKALAVGHDQAFFAGSYDNPEAVFEFSLTTASIQKLDPISTAGSSIRAQEAFGRANTLYLVTEDQLFCRAF